MLKIIRKGRKLVHLLRSPDYWRGLTKGVAAAIEHESALRPLALATVVDIGANRGQFSVLALGLFPNVAIHAFEPLNEAADVYETVFSDCSRVHLHRYAAGSGAEKARINISAQADSSSLLPITEAQNAIFPGTQAIGTREIDVRRVDDVLCDADLASPLMIKLDVQGFELTALEGMPLILERADFAYVEVTFLPLYGGQPLAHEVIAWLRERGFALSGIYNLTTTAEGVAVQADVLFARQHRGLAQGVAP